MLRYLVAVRYKVEKTNLDLTKEIAHEEDRNSSPFN